MRKTPALVYVFCFFIHQVYSQNYGCAQRKCDGPKFSSSNCCEGHVCTSSYNPATPNMLVCTDTRERLKVLSLEEMLGMSHSSSSGRDYKSTSYNYKPPNIGRNMQDTLSDIFGSSDRRKSRNGNTGDRMIQKDYKPSMTSYQHDTNPIQSLSAIKHPTELSTAWSAVSGALSTSQSQLHPSKQLSSILQKPSTLTVRTNNDKTNEIINITRTANKHKTSKLPSAMIPPNQNTLPIITRQTNNKQPLNTPNILSKLYPNNPTKSNNIASPNENIILNTIENQSNQKELNKLLNANTQNKEEEFINRNFGLHSVLNDPPRDLSLSDNDDLLRKISDLKQQLSNFENSMSNIKNRDKHRQTNDTTKASESNTNKELLNINKQINNSNTMTPTKLFDPFSEKRKKIELLKRKKLLKRKEVQNV